MSMITGCPACGTMFRVVPDQLKISEGWVRCGHCAEVFDATAHLQSAEPALQPAAGVAPAAPPEEAIADPQALAVPETVPATLAPPAAEEIQAEDAHADVEVIEVENPYSEFPSSFHPPSVQPAEDEPGYLPPEADADTSGRSRPAPLAEDVDSEVPDSALRDGAAESGLDEVSFVREARRKAFWRRPLVRFALLLVVLALAAVLGLQYAVHERGRLAATHPQWRVLLEQLCEPLACTVGPPHRIDAILIDNSGFTRLRADTYRLSFTLKNQSAQPVAVPALQLTLTDTQDQAVVQRVLTPRELGASGDTIAPASEWTASVALAVNAGAARVAGYRLLAFYP
jgi:predicted Zn finger-like uncharacterized protein